MHALPAASPGIALMLLFNIGAAALLLPLRYGLGGAALAALALIGEMRVDARCSDGGRRAAARRTDDVLGVASSRIAMLTYLLGRQMRASQALAERRGAEVNDLAEINELIIRRMRTGVVVVDGDGGLRLANEAALLLLGEAGEGERNLMIAAPDLHPPPAQMAAGRRQRRHARCGSARTRPKCCRASRACWPTATRRWSSSTTRRSSRAAPNR